MDAMIAAVILLVMAAFRVQTAYERRLDSPLVAQPHINSAIRLAVAGMVCFVAAKVLS